MTAPEESVVAHVVDDDEALRQSLAFLLESVGIQAFTYPTATAFLEEYDPEEVAIVIVDVRMPVMSGLQLQEELQARKYPAPVIFCSAHGDIPMSVRAMRGGAVDFFEKPYEPQRMIEVVQVQLVRAQRVFAERAQVREILVRLDSLTSREREVLRLVVDGQPSQVIATQLGASVKTIDVHRARIKAKTEAESLATLVRDILRHGVDL